MRGLFTLHFIAFSICSFANNFERSSAASMEPKKPTMDDVKEMLSTREKIWMTLRTYHNPRRDCIHWVNNGLNSTDYDFFYWERKLPRPGQWSRGALGKLHKHAKIEYSDKGPVMKTRAHWEKVHEAEKYLLLFWSASEKCFILKRDQENSCEQFTWDSRLSKPTSQCDKMFRENCGAVMPKVSTRSCPKR
ncbi:uncharacterized protein LOC142774481 [Rhipicephalus microplus]|uniref:uncharacterized protein LOC142774481 n=1 Tax=Rhipicephalus microplus TaxID=6941 RepID=UPI003F6BF75C